MPSPKLSPERSENIINYFQIMFNGTFAFDERANIEQPEWSKTKQNSTPFVGSQDVNNGIFMHD